MKNYALGIYDIEKDENILHLITAIDEIDAIGKIVGKEALRLILAGNRNEQDIINKLTDISLMEDAEKAYTDVIELREGYVYVAKAYIFDGEDCSNNIVKLPIDSLMKMGIDLGSIKDRNPVDFMDCLDSSVVTYSKVKVESISEYIKTYENS